MRTPQRACCSRRAAASASRMATTSESGTRSPQRAALRGRRHSRCGRRRPARRRWNGFPAQWYNPGDAKGAVRGRSGLRTPVSRLTFKGLDLALTPRQERVLRVVIEDYIASGAPVGSKYLSEHFAFGVAASTIRNDLADLEDMGMLAHRHTSAGRVPTDVGYRPVSYTHL